MLRFTILFALATLTSCQTRAPRVETDQAASSTQVSYKAASSNAFQPALNRVKLRLEGGTATAKANEALMLESGSDALAARLHLIEHAQYSIDYQTFIWANDEASQLLAEALIQAAKRGINIRILVDYIGIAKDAEALAKVTHAHPNLQIRVYRPTARTLENGIWGSIAYALTNFKGANQRMHNKVFLVDNHIAITGGRNVENSYFDHAAVMNFKDRDALIVGPVAQSIGTAFDSFWSYRHTVPAIQLTDVASANVTRTAPPQKSRTGQKLLALKRRSHQINALANRLRSVDHVEFISDLPGKNGALLLAGGGQATEHIVRALDEAKQEVWIQSPYMVLGRKGRSFFKRFRKRNPNIPIHISTNSFGSTDNLIAYAGNVRLRDRYVHEFGLDLREYRPRPSDLRRVLPTYDWLAESKQNYTPFLCIHAKSFVVDDKLAFVGSFNLDPRSAHLNTECGLIFRDTRIASQLKREIQRDMSASNSWAIAPRALLKDISDIHMYSKEITDLSPVDLTLLSATSAFELKPGFKEVPKENPNFYRNYRDIGSFPGSPSTLTDRELKARFLKFSTRLFDPLL